MKKLTIILMFFALMASSCGNLKTQEIDFGNSENPLFGKIYRDITDIPELSHWQPRGGSVIYTNKYEDGSFRFGIEYFNDENDNVVLLFVELLPPDESGRPDRKILDSINTGKCGKGSDFLSFLCRINEEQDSEIVAIVFWEDGKEVLNNVARAWRANTNTGQFEVLDVEGIDCWNEGYSA